MSPRSILDHLDCVIRAAPGSARRLRVVSLSAAWSCVMPLSLLACAISVIILVPFGYRVWGSLMLSNPLGQVSVGDERAQSHVARQIARPLDHLALLNLVMPAADLIISGDESPNSIMNKLRLNKGGRCKRANACQKKSVAR